MRLLVGLCLCASLEAHKFHYSRTEINWNTAARRVEIIATLHADDIETRLRQSHAQLELDRDKRAEKLVCAYTAGALALGALRPRCIGMKVGRDYVDVYLEAAVEAPPKVLTNRILIENLPDQRNDVELRKDGKLLGPRIQFNTSETRKEVRW
ncbi:MAG: hypothetical protein JNM66_10485 [Bryobacterales bacterium]|nr:hypothetical protein [Bryobacterales bacterium]